ncbi:alpha-glucan phosphorylase [Paenibacillus mucilaginosus 3016]|uniref:Alpha-glucan phosphorylase n=1 Tax=Paenibacillus mucilaginosus 3016 TaxID=1116391 RepID=H6N9G6_9BACL|nr:alpha-glucan family phosphorylase [Paenibacillus mucilaginosus]AFC27972.1 alpha-glucan phosphorylase [Paenibacillus mucilaginosus 3016]WFA16828.1 alpha-glucan family phosphorylase [Paenibacillus mucilaginosus]
MLTKFQARNIKLPARLRRLSELAYNLWFSWNDSALSLFSRIDPVLWNQYQHNPVRLLTEIDPAVLEKRAQDSGFLKTMDAVLNEYDEYMAASTWFSQQYPQHTRQAIAYFSAEFGFHESLPIYSGGLGVLAGDHCKSASDLGIPLAGIGLLYKKGYFNQKLDGHGAQFAESVSYDFDKLPIIPAYVPAENGAAPGEELYVTVAVADREVRLKVWQVQVGRNPVYLLDADLEVNSPWDRELTAQLYGGNQDTRIAQEILLGVGGVKALRALGLPTGAYHINEGHAAFLAFERIREQLDKGLPFHVALEIIRASTVFTTHTPVPAGHDAFPMAMFDYYFSRLFHDYAQHREAFRQLGYDQGKNAFNMTYLAMNAAALRNGVSKLHGHVSREMFRAFHGDIDVREVPIGHITNGIHLPTWLAPELKELYSRFLPGTWTLNQANPDLWEKINLIPDESLWSVHKSLKEKLVLHARANLREHRRRNSMTAERIEEVREYLNPDALTIGFARRFATYKRANLIFGDLDRLDRLVNDPERPVQFLFAGKAHPADHPGQELIREIYRVSQMDRFRGKVVLLENYDMNLARYLVQGVDVWLNNPRRPYEASGTSGEKAAMNGVINFSVLDGWWEEGYDGTNGWSIEANNEADFETQERENTESIYRVLEEEIVPLYYSESGVPSPWVKRMKRSIVTLAPMYNTDRMVMDYTNVTYVPSLQRTQHFVANEHEEATKVADYKRFIRENWHHVRIVEVNDGGTVQNAEKEVTATVKFGPVWYKDTAVEILYYEERPGGWEPVLVPMEPARELEERTVLYRARIPGHLKHGAHFSVRVHPVSANFIRRFELPLLTSL